MLLTQIERMNSHVARFDYRNTSKSGLAHLQAIRSQLHQTFPAHYTKLEMTYANLKITFGNGFKNFL
jgi:hypothetical protein